jgi:hypothetical protein
MISMGEVAQSTGFAHHTKSKKHTRGINYEDHSPICKHGSDNIYITIHWNNVVSYISMLKIVSLATTCA